MRPATGVCSTDTRREIDTIRRRVVALRDPATGLYETFQDAEDEYVRKPFSIYDNVLTWKAMNDLAALGDRTGRCRSPGPGPLAQGRNPETWRALGADGAKGPIFAATVSATEGDFMDVPPGSLMKLPLLGFIAEDDPLFVRTYEWFHSENYPYSYADQAWDCPEAIASRSRPPGRSPTICG